MEKLNAEQVKADLEKWIKNYDGKVLNFVTLGNALTLINSHEQRIKELAEEREKLQRLCELRERDHNDALDLLYKAEAENERVMREKTALECVVSTARNQARADTVRKMQERLRFEIINKPSEFLAAQGTVDFLNGSAHRQLEILDIIDQIAKELTNEGS